MKSIKTAVIYARYSSDNQSEQSIEGQMHVCEDYAKTNDIVILDKYIDRAMTGTNDNRPSFQRMLADSAKKKWDYVLVYKFDRFSRNKYETLKHKKTLKDNGVQLISATEYLPDTPERIIIESLFEGYAEYYSAELSQKVKRGMKETRRKGQFQGGILPYGYKLDNKKIVIDKQQAKVVRYLFEQYSLGVIVNDILAEFNSKGILNRGKPFVKNTLYNMLRNEKYSGVYRYGGEVYTDMYPQIVPPETYKKVRALLLKNKHGKQSTTTVYLLRHKLYCGYCGSTIVADGGTGRNGEVQHYYKCTGRRKKNGCKQPVVRKELLENFVVESSINFLMNQDNIDMLIDSLVKEQDSMSETNMFLSMFEKEKRQAETALENLMKAVEQGLYSNSTAKRIRELESRIAILDESISIEKNKTCFKIEENEMREFFAAALKHKPQLLIYYLIDKIVLYEDKIEIFFNSPIEKGPDENQGFLLYSGIGKMSYVYRKNSVPTVKYMKLEIYIYRKLGNIGTFCQFINIRV